MSKTHGLNKIILNHIKWLNGLASHKNFSHIEYIYGLIPNKFKQNILFELSLSEKESPVDISFSMFSDNIVRDIGNDTRPEIDFSAIILENPAWHKIQNFYINWAEPGGLLYNKILNIWLEFDTKSSSEMCLTPNVFFRSIPISLQDTFATSNSINQNSHEWVTQIAIPILNNFSTPQVTEHNIVNLIKLLPKSNHIGYYIGVMLPRQSEQIKFVTRGFSKDQIVPYLMAIGLFKEKSKHLIDKISNFFDCVNISLDVGGSINPVVGLECWLQPPLNNERWFNFIKYLTNEGMCLKVKKSIILNYLLESRGEINHAKVTFHSEKFIEAKVYLKSQ
jgi:hypothetical protein